MPRLHFDNQDELSQLKKLVAEFSPENPPSQLKDFVSDITHIITCLNKLSIPIENPALKERLLNIAHIDVSYFEQWDIKHVNDKFCPVELQNSFRIAKYLGKRLGKANTRRRQLLKYYESVSKPATSTVEDDNADQIELSQPVEIERDEDRISQTSSSTSSNKEMCPVPALPARNAVFEGDPFECPYCFKIVKVRNQQDWRYVDNSRYARNFSTTLNILSGDMFLGTFNPMFAHSANAPVQANYIAANALGFIMCSTTTESGIVLPAQSLFHQGRNFVII